MNQSKSQYLYHAYGLDFCSSIVLPELIRQNEANRETSVTVKIVSATASQAHRLPDHRYHISPEKAYVCFTEVGLFHINKGREIRVAALPDVEESLVRVPLLGASMAVLLYQLGKFVLHASAVSVGGRAIAFMGDKGFGKSTMAAMFCGLGYELLADDVVAAEINEARDPAILPGYPQLKLYPDAAVAAFNDDPEKLPRLASILEKRARRTEKFCKIKQPLGAIYVLEEGADIRINRLQPQEAVRALICNSYMARFAADWLTNGLAKSNLRHCTAIANRIPVYSLERPRDLESLRGVAKAVDDHISTLHDLS